MYCQTCPTAVPAVAKADVNCDGQCGKLIKGFRHYCPDCSVRLGTCEQCGCDLAAEKNSQVKIDLQQALPTQLRLHAGQTVLFIVQKVWAPGSRIQLSTSKSTARQNPPVLTQVFTQPASPRDLDVWGRFMAHRAGKATITVSTGAMAPGAKLRRRYIRITVS